MCYDKFDNLTTFFRLNDSKLDKTKIICYHLVVCNSFDYNIISIMSQHKPHVFHASAVFDTGRNDVNACSVDI